MTYQARPWSAVDAIISAGRDSKAQASKPDQAAGAIITARKPAETSAAALTLSRILAATLAGAKPCVQFVSCSAGSGVSAAVSISEAAANILGPTLLLDARMQDNGDVEASQRNEPVPDGFIPGLHHHHLAHDSCGLDMLFGRARRGAFTALIAPFRFVAIDSQSPKNGVAVTALAPMCTGTVLVVRAGRSSHADIKDAALHITRAGGRVIGSILDDAPAKLPGWIRRQ